MKICASCNGINSDNYKFCSNCGVERETLKPEEAVGGEVKINSNPSPSDEEKRKKKAMRGLGIVIFVFVAIRFYQTIGPVYKDSHYPFKSSSPFESTVSHADCQKAFDRLGVRYERANVDFKAYTLDKKSYTTKKRDGFLFYLGKNNYHLALYDNNGLLVSLGKYGQNNKTIFYQHGKDARFAMYQICYQVITGKSIINVRGMSRN